MRNGLRYEMTAPVDISHTWHELTVVTAQAKHAMTMKSS